MTKKLLIKLMFLGSFYLVPSYAMDPESESLSSSCEVADDDFLGMFGFVETEEKNQNFQELAKIGCNVPAVLCGNQTLGILRHISEGNFCKLNQHVGRGLVYLSNDRVLKLCDNNKEAIMINRLDGYFKNMPTIFDVKTLQVPMHINGCDVMSYIEMAKGSKTLEAWMLEEGKSPNDKLQVILKLARTIKDLHALGVMHGDLKPANILLDNDQVLLIDFDQTREFGIGAGNDNGTPNYCNYQMSNRITSKKIDVFSLGLISYEIFYGKTFFHAADDIESLYLILAKVDEVARQLINSRLDETKSAQINGLLALMMSDVKLDKIIQELELIIS